MGIIYLVRATSLKMSTVVVLFTLLLLNDGCDVCSEDLRDDISTERSTCRSRHSTRSNGSTSTFMGNSARCHSTKV